MQARWGALAAVCLTAASTGVALAQPGVRSPVLAGTWYPEESGVLAQEVDRLLAEAPAPAGEDPVPVRALLVPHAALRFSGAVAASGFRRVQGMAAERVVVLAPAHRSAGAGLMLTDAAAFATPLGEVAVDREANARIALDPLARVDPAAHRVEHAVEVQLPFLQRALAPGWRLVPLLVGELGAGDEVRLARIIAPLLGPRTLLVVSGDFTHYGERFGYQPFPADGEARSRLAALDEGAFALIAARDPTGLAGYRERTGITACAVGPARILAAFLPAGARLERTAYATSGDLTGDYRHCVSYLAAVWRWEDTALEPSGTGPPAATGGLDPQDLGYLHALASAAVAASVAPADQTRTRLQALLDGVPEALQQPGGAFVTLRRNGELRGCIGVIDPRGPLYAVVADQAANAALRDPRFSPVTAAELSDLAIEVSVLSAPRPIESWTEFVVGDQGVIMSRDGRRAVFLPEVPIDQGWGAEETLSHLARKAGLEPQAWRNGARLAVFTTQRHTGGPHGPQP